MSEQTGPDLLSLTAKIVSAHVAASKTEPDALPTLIQSVYSSLAKAGAPEPEPIRQDPAVPVKKSIQQEYLVCLEDGAKVKMLKRYLATRYKLTPAQYRVKWGLSADYPMVAPAYAEKRSALAKEVGLGRKRGGTTEAAASAPVPEPAPQPAAAAPAKRGRKKAS